MTTPAMDSRRADSENGQQIYNTMLNKFQQQHRMKYEVVTKGVKTVWTDAKAS